jgi:hypothetical protein
LRFHPGERASGFVDAARANLKFSRRDQRFRRNFSPPPGTKLCAALSRIVSQRPPFPEAALRQEFAKNFYGEKIRDRVVPVRVRWRKAEICGGRDLQGRPESVQNG